MDANELTADELRKLADEKSSVRTLDIDGFIVHVDTEKCKSWKAYRLVSKLADGNMNNDAVQAMIEFVELVADVDESKIVKHCGGENASLESVMHVISRIISESYPKNS